MLKEFKEFAFKGNLIDMAVGIIIGGAFGTVVKSLVEDVVMPVVGLAGNMDFSDQFTVLKTGEGVADGTTYATAEAAKEVAGNVVMTWGNFATAFLSFLIVAMVLFIIIKKVVGALEKKEEEPDPAPPKEEVLLTEIRDLLAKKV